MTEIRTTDARQGSVGASRSSEVMPERAPAADRTAQRALDMFQAQYDVKILGEQKISFAIPQGKSCADVLRDAHLISQIVYGRSILNYSDFDRLIANPALAVPKESTRSLAVDGNFPMERGRGPEIQTLLGKVDKTQTSEADFLVSAVAYQLLTGKEFFTGAVHVDGGIYFHDREGGGPNKDVICKHSDQYVYRWSPLLQEHTTSVYLPTPPRPAYPSAAERAHANALAERTPTGDPDEAARQGKY